MEIRTVEYVDSDYEVKFEVEQATLSKQYQFEALQSWAQREFPLEAPDVTGEAGLAELSRRFYMVSLYPAIKAVTKVVEDKKGNFPEIKPETMDTLPAALIYELRDAIYELNPHWSPFFVRAKPTGSG